MSPGAVLELLEARGIRLAVVNGFLRYRAPVGAYTDEIRALVAEHRYTLIEEWRCWFCGRITRTLYGLDPVVLCLRCHRRTQIARAVALLFAGSAPTTEGGTP